MAKLGLLVLLILSLYSAGDAKKVLCYYENSSTYRNGGCSYTPNHEGVSAKYCTHMVYSYANVDEKGNVVSSDTYSDLEQNYGKGGYKKINALKDDNDKLSTILVVGSANCREAFSKVASRKELREDLTTNIVTYLRYYGFDGVLIDWHLPSADDKANYASLIKLLRDELDAEKLLLGITAPPYETQLSTGFKMSALSMADFVVVESFFYRDIWSYGVFHPSPLHQCDGDKYSAAYMDNVAHIVEVYASKGLEKEKIIVGAYGNGRAFALKDPRKPVQIGSPAQEASYSPCTLMGGIISYDESCDKTWEALQDESCSATLRVRGGVVAAVESPESIAAKAEFAKNYGGMFLKSMDGDDWDGSCGKEQALLSIMYKTLVD